jgi:hypothetical protein
MWYRRWQALGLGQSPIGAGLRRTAWKRPYPKDLLERAVQHAEAGETIRSIAAALRISPSCVFK